jgi:DNA repair photolyase
MENTESQYIPATCKSALNNLRRENPYKWDLNIYRGCEHCCVYCYALYSHDYLNDGQYFSHVYVKTNIVEQLEKKLRMPSWKREVINIGSVCDSYQPAEAEYKIMPEILKLLIKYKTPAIISTKSDLILRDYDLIDQLSRITYINVAATITAIDEGIRTKIEPNGCSSLKRFEMLKTFRKTNASVGMHVMPILPYLTDSEENIDALFAHAKDSGVHYALPGTLNLRGKTRPYYLNFIRMEYPYLYEKTAFLFRNGGLDKDYKKSLHQMVSRLFYKYALTNNYTVQIEKKIYKERNLFSDL